MSILYLLASEMAISYTDCSVVLKYTDTFKVGGQWVHSGRPLVMVKARCKVEVNWGVFTPSNHNYKADLLDHIKFPTSLRLRKVNFKRFQM